MASLVQFGAVLCPFGALVGPGRAHQTELGLIAAMTCTAGSNAALNWDFAGWAFLLVLTPAYCASYRKSSGSSQAGRSPKSPSVAALRRHGWVHHAVCMRHRAAAAAKKKRWSPGPRMVSPFTAQRMDPEDVSAETVETSDQTDKEDSQVGYQPKPRFPGDL